MVKAVLVRGRFFTILGTLTPRSNPWKSCFMLRITCVAVLAAIFFPLPIQPCGIAFAKEAKPLAHARSRVLTTRARCRIIRTSVSQTPSEPVHIRERSSCTRISWATNLTSRYSRHFRQGSPQPRCVARFQMRTPNPQSGIPLHCQMIQAGEITAIIGDASRDGIGGTQYCGLWSLTSKHWPFNAFGNT